MIIKQLACERFAGVRDADLRFSPGMNILLGENESGKSTMADLLYHLFFQETKLDGRKDKAFLDACFPKGTEADGDIIDGTVRFDTENGSYKLYKEWAAGGNVCRLTLPEGTRISKPKEIRRILDEQLHYGRGIYDEVIFASQKRRSALLSGLLEQQQKEKKNEATAMQELSATLNKAVLETGGVALDKVEQQLLAHMNACAGRWDFGAQLPEGGKARGIRNPWKVNCGSILSAYYAMETAAEDQRRTEEIEKEIEALNGQLLAAKQRKQAAAEARERFAAFQSVIASRENLKTLHRNAADRLGTMRDAADQWPVLEDRKIKVEQLQQSLEQAVRYELSQAVSGLQRRRTETRDRLDAIGAIDQADVRAAERCTAAIAGLEAKIRGLNLAAKLQVLGDTPVSVVTAADNQPLDTGSGSFAITEAVEITVPGVMQLQLAPRGVDLEQIRQELAQARQQLADLFARYGVETLAQLQENFREAGQLTNALTLLDQQISTQLAGIDPAELQSPEQPADTAAQIQAQLRQLCKGRSADSFLGTLTALIQNYAAQYGSQESLADQIATLQAELEGYAAKLTRMADIPAEYQNISDPDAYAAQLKAAEEAQDAALDTLHDRLRDTQLPPDSKSAEEYGEDYRRLKEKFEDEQARYHRWAHIHEVFTRLKDQELGNPTRDIQTHFQDHLTALSGGGIRLNDMDEKLRSAMVSGHSRLTYTTLSEGTKDTISLAFRLAMLEHLFPDGGAVAVFDDPFTDMDPRRTAQACRLLQRFAERNQVLFITCDDKYTRLLEGNVIPVSEN